MKKEIIMKKINFIILSLITFTLLSCEDFLNVSSPSSFNSDYVFSNSADAKRMVLGVYALFTEDPFTSRMSCVWAQNTDVEAMEHKIDDLPADRNAIFTLQGALLNGWGDNANAWDNNFLAVDRSNQCIEGIKASKIANDKDMQQMLGECYSLRAYRYLMLTQMWGDVPYFRQSAKAGIQLDIPRTDKNKIYSMSIQDLVNCEDKMYFADEFSDGIERMNREFALGLIARISLFRAGYSMNADGTMKRADDYLDVANNDSLVVTYNYNGVNKTARTYKDYYQLTKDYTEKLMILKDRQLNPNFAQIFKNECQLQKPKNDDVLFEIAFGSANSGGDVGWCIGVPVKASSKGTTTIQVGICAGYYYTFDPNDVRRDATINNIQYDTETSQSVVKIVNMSVGKWNRLWATTPSMSSTSSKGTAINWPLMRYSDVLLMFAEAENELNGPTASAKQALRRVRNRAFSDADKAVKVEHYIDSVSADNASFFKAVVNERAWEFGGECLRKYDLVRWNLYGAKIDETVNMLRNIAKAANAVELDNPAVAKYSTFADRRYYKSVGGVISFYNNGVTYADAATANGAGYASYIDWAKSSAFYTGGADGTYLKYTWNGYQKHATEAGNAVSYLLPIPAVKTGASKYLNNNGYRLNQY